MASLAATPTGRTRSLLAELTRAHLVEQRSPGRYGLHDLLRIYADELTHHHDDDDQRRAAVRRMLEHYLCAARAAVDVFDPAAAVPPLAAPPDSVVVPAFDDLRSATTWLTAELATLVALVRLDDRTADDYTVRLASTVTNFCYLRGYHHQQSVVQTAALAAAQRLGDTVAQAHSHRVLGTVQFHLTRFDQALAHHDKALGLLGPSGNPVERAEIHHSVAFALNQSGRHRDALDHAEQALGLFQCVDHPRQAQELGFVGVCHAMLGDNARAIEFAGRSLALHETVSDPYGTAAPLWCLGQAHHNLGRHPESIAAYRKLAAVHERFGNREFLAETLMRLGDVHDDAGEPQRANQLWRQAADIFTELGHANAAKARARL